MRARDNGHPALSWFHGRRIALTGGAGFRGRVVMRKRRERGCHRVTSPRRASCELLRWDPIEPLLDQYRPHLLLPVAATFDSRAGHRDVAESFYNRVMMKMTQLREASRRHGLAKMICIGSASSYAANAPVPRCEPNLFHRLPDPAHAIHGIAKRLPFIQAHAYRRQHGFDCVRLFPTDSYRLGGNFEPKTTYLIALLLRKFVPAVDTGATEIAIGGSNCATRDFIQAEEATL